MLVHPQRRGLEVSLVKSGTINVMKRWQFEATLADDASLKVPAIVAAQIPKQTTVRVVVLLQDNEEADWKRLAVEEFQAGYCDADAIYDSI